MLDSLPVYINPLKFSEKGKVIVGLAKISELDRLADTLFDDSGEIRVDLSFGKEGRLAYVQGKVQANLMLKCQACLGLVNWSVDIEFKLAIVSSMEQANKISSDYEPLILEDDKVLLKGLIEDELLLILPDFPRHDFDCNKGDKMALLSNNNEDDLEIKADNPFSILKKLKNTGDK